MLRRVVVSSVTLVVLGFAAGLTEPRVLAQKSGKPLTTKASELSEREEREEREKQEEEQGSGREKATGESVEEARLPNEEELSQDDAKEKTSKPFPSQRLPRFFSGLVDSEQRLQIHEIQAQFRFRIAQLEAELKSLKQEEMSAMQNVLTSTQQRLLEKKRQESSGARRSVANTAESAPSTAHPDPSTSDDGLTN